jgi:hypothetical protein
MTVLSDLQCHAGKRAHASCKDDLFQCGEGEAEMPGATPTAFKARSHPGRSKRSVKRTFRAVLQSRRKQSMQSNIVKLACCLWLKSGFLPDSGEPAQEEPALWRRCHKSTRFRTARRWRIAPCTSTRLSSSSKDAPLIKDAPPNKNKMHKPAAPIVSAASAAENVLA